MTPKPPGKTPSGSRWMTDLTPYPLSSLAERGRRQRRSQDCRRRSVTPLSTAVERGQGVRFSLSRTPSQPQGRLLVLGRFLVLSHIVVRGFGRLFVVRWLVLVLVLGVIVW